jgi:inward rectifier potassium channel
MAPREEEKDLGFGSLLAQESPTRLLNRDGTFNVRRVGTGPLASLNLYHQLLELSWPRFLGLVAAMYLVANAVFGVLFFLCGPGALRGDVGEGTVGRLMASFNFSVETFATIGYGNITPHGFAANLLVTVESLAGLLVFAIGTGLVFARFSRPVARIVFSDVAVVAPYRGITAWEFRIVNGRSNQLIEVEVKVSMSRRVPGGGGRREFFELALERDRVALFPLSWTVVHPIDANSPLHGWTEAGLHESDAEFLILLTGIDETFAQQVHARSSYKPGETVWGARFTPILQRLDGSAMSVDVSLIHGYERTPVPGAAAVHLDGALPASGRAITSGSVAGK